MYMLKKQKWSVDPRNNNWSKDESKFGQKMLEKMGWSKGKGLGAQEQGSTEHVKVLLKSNKLGLGAAVNHEDNFVFSTPVDKEKGTFSLEEKSKSSSKRVHYQKFTKGKDLSSRSETDLACIFGKRSKRGRESQDKEQVEDSGNAETLGDPKSNEPEAESNTVTSTLSMQEYFAQKMIELKKSKVVKEPHQTNVDNIPQNERDLAEYKAKSKKKKKRNKKETEETYACDQLSIKQAKNTEVEMSLNGIGEMEISSVKENHQIKKKSKKQRKVKNSDSVGLDHNVCTLDEADLVETQDQCTAAVNNSTAKHNKTKKNKKKETSVEDKEDVQSSHILTQRKRKKGNKKQKELEVQ
uniref:PIN2 (TERF1) interacting telomerase inhibitor 1 n=1 Tax=Callorhinchus milii TaxID=7868 RepID=A0A4W3JQH6_CALMI